MKHIILAQSKVTASALHGCWQLIVGEDVAATELGSEQIIFNPAGFSHEGGIPAYHHLVRRLEVACDFDHETGSYDSTVVLVDCVKPLQLSAAQEAFTWDKLTAMLVLTFPELHWVFGVTSGKDFDEDGTFPRSDHSLSSLCKPLQCWLFDPSGLRDWVRKQTGNSLTPPNSDQTTKAKAKVSYLPRRKESAIALDDETDYAFLNAYTAYRFGFRATPVSTFTLATALLGRQTGEHAADEARMSSDSSVSALPPRVIFEDIYLNFADGKPGLSKLYFDARANEHESKGRCKEWELLEKIEYRFFITSGQRVPGDDEKHERNRAYIEQQLALGRHIKTLAKPHAGMFKLWRQTGLARLLRSEWQTDSETRVRYGLARGFFSPPVRPLRVDDVHGHSTPGPLLIIAETLIRRSEESLKSGVKSVERAVRGAVLATDALELLGGRTGTVAVQALRLKHQFELLAECQFAGVEHHFEINARLEEIGKEAVHISKWFGRRERHAAALNAEMQVLLDIVKVLRDYGQFDEEQALMNRIRFIHNTLWMRQRPWRLVMWPVFRYVEFVLGSFSRFALSLTVWVIVLAVLFWISDITTAGAVTTNSGDHGMRLALSRALESFVGKGLPTDPNVIRDILYVLATSAGLLHIGAFVSLLYSTVSRK